MSQPVVFLVGDEYASFATNPHVMTLRELRARVLASDARQDDLRVVVGQGMRHEDAAAPCDAVAATKAGVAIEAAAAPASLAVTHKRDAANVLISEPRRTRPRTYEMELLLNDGEDRLVDHVTGQHVSGMVLVEAARQAGIASAEIELLATRDKPFGFVWNGLRVDFARFAFPLPTRIEVTIREEAAEGKSQPTYVADVEVVQAGQCVCTMAMTFGLLPASLLGALEAKAARRAIDGARATYASSAQVSPPQVAAPQAAPICAPPLSAAGDG